MAEKYEHKDIVKLLRADHRVNLDEVVLRYLYVNVCVLGNAKKCETCS